MDRRDRSLFGQDAADRTFGRALRAAGLVVLTMVCLPVLLHGGIDPRRLAIWGGVCAVFAASLWVSAGAARRGIKAALLTLESACVTAMVLLLCDGFEGSLLVLVALQIGRAWSVRTGAIAIAVQTALLAIAIGVHWTPSAALLLSPPYLGFQILAFVVARLVAQQEESRRELARVNADLRAQRGVAEENSRLAERVRIARDLHDAVGHHLTALRLHLEVAARTAEGPAREACETARSLAGDALDEVRTVVSSLREGDRIDLVTALHAMAAEIPSPRVHVTAPPGLTCPDASRAIALLRCAQEIMTNAARHAGATNLWIEIALRDGAIEIDAKDDGQGAAEVQPGSGLRGMRERIEQAGGRLDVASARGEGFTLRASVPAGTT